MDWGPSDAADIHSFGLFKGRNCKAVCSANCTTSTASLWNLAWARTRGPLAVDRHVGAVGQQPAGLHVVGKEGIEDLDQPLLEIRVEDGEHDLQPLQQVPPHPVGAGQIDLFMPAVAEVEHAGVLQVAIDDGTDLDVVGNAFHAGPQHADPADVRA